MIKLVDVVIILFGISLLNVTVSGRLEVSLKILSLQGFLLFVAAVASLPAADLLGLIVVAVETLVFKTAVIPWYLRKVIRENGLYRESEPRISNFYSLVAGSALFLFGLIAAYWAAGSLSPIRPLHFGVSISTILVGIFIILNRKQLISHIVGYIILENGIFLLSLAAASVLPIVVELGIALDIFVGVFIFGLLVKQIRFVFREQHVDRLTGLKG